VSSSKAIKQSTGAWRAGKPNPRGGPQTHRLRPHPPSEFQAHSALGSNPDFRIILGLANAQSPCWLPGDVLYVAKEPPAPPLSDGRCSGTVWRRSKFKRRHEHIFKNLRIAQAAICKRGKRLSATWRMFITPECTELYGTIPTAELVSLPNGTLTAQSKSDKNQ
jgi:hypothetical protein